MAVIGFSYGAAKSMSWKLLGSFRLFSLKRSRELDAVYAMKILTRDSTYVSGTKVISRNSDAENARLKGLAFSPRLSRIALEHSDFETAQILAIIWPECVLGSFWPRRRSKTSGG